MVYLAAFVHFTSFLLLTACGIDLLSAITGVTACMFNVGPGLGTVGPMDNYGHLPEVAKWVLSADMLIGRLEFYTALVIFHPAFWKE
jgi:trk system potassium uptake protein TrkH